MEKKWVKEDGFLFYCKPFIDMRGKKSEIYAKVREGGPFPFYWIVLNDGKEISTLESGKSKSADEAKKQAQKSLEEFFKGFALEELYKVSAMYPRGV